MPYGYAGVLTKMLIGLPIKKNTRFLGLGMYLLLLSACGTSSDYDGISTSNVLNDNSAHFEEQDGTTYGYSEEVRVNFHKSPKYAATAVRAIAHYKNPESVHRNGYVTGYLAACPSISRYQHNLIIENQLEMIELASTDVSLYANGIPNKALISSKKRLFRDGLQDGINAANVIGEDIQGIYCGSILDDFRKSIWDWANE